MHISKLNWIFLSNGRLYSPPFVSSHLLYRIKDRGVSVLVRHPQTTTSKITEDRSIATIVESTVREPSALEVLLGPSATMSLQEIEGIAPILMNLSDQAAERDFNGLVLTTEPVRLPASRMCELDTSSQFCEIDVGGTPFTIESPRPIRVCEYARKLDVLLRFWRMSLTNARTGVSYDLNTETNWSVTATDISENVHLNLRRNP